MAAGDKKPVVMEADLAKPGGPATLNENGKLSESQRPSLEDLGGANRTLSNITDPAAARANLGAAGNKDLLHNSRWDNPDSIIDQRGEYYAPMGTPYYSDAGLTTQVGTLVIDNPVKGIYDTYAEVYYCTDTPSNGLSVDKSVTYYVSTDSVKRGHVGRTGYCIDRWYRGWTYKQKVEPVSGGLKIGFFDGADLSAATAGSNIEQRIEHPERFAGKQLTVSFLVAETTSVHCYGYVAWSEDGVSKSASTGIISGAGLYTAVATPSVGAQITNLRVGMYGADVRYGDTGTEYTVVTAAKLELGSVQTLAHQDADGNWVLNDPPPDRGLELLKYQRYYQLFSSQDKIPTSLADYRPAMRTTPTTGTISIAGQTYYFADANL